jgi:hypothetical protein
MALAHVLRLRGDRVTEQLAQQRPGDAMPEAA